VLLAGLSLVATAAPAQNPPDARRPTPDASRLDRGRFTAVFYESERTLANALLDRAIATDTFPGLPRPTQRVVVAVAPDRERFREWIGPRAPEWGAAVAFPESHRIVMQGRSAGSDAGDPVEVLRHELAHLALHEYLGDVTERWFDEGYAAFAAREWSRDEVLSVNLALALRGTPTLERLDELFGEGSQSAQTAYALAHRAVVELASLDPDRGLSRYFEAWKQFGSMDRAMRSAYGITLDGFEKLWQQRTRRRYGALALLGDLTIVGLVSVVLLFPLYSARRKRDRERMAALVAADEAAERAARASAIDELLRGDEPASGDDATGERPPS
jgi:hypothetical protein